MADKISFATLNLAKAYTDESIEGAGAIKGKNCQIQSITNIEGGHRITFAWYNESEVLLTDTLDVMDGEDGAKGDTGNGIVKIEKTATSGLTDTYTITFTDGTTFDYDVVNGADSDVLSVNGKTGNVTLSTNDLVNDSGFIQNTVNNLVNYYLKSQIYTKTEVENIVSAISTLSLDPVEQLPTTDISTTTIYLIPSSSQGVMDQYINLDGTTTGWVKIGDTSIDLTNYVTTSDLTLALADYVTESELSTYVVDANYVHTDNNYTDTDKVIVGGVTSALALKADKSEIPENTSDLTNDSGFITNTVNNLANYYLKSETYTQNEIDALIAAAKNGRFIYVAILPTTDIDTKAIYLVPSADPEAGNTKDEYINLTGTSAGWELIGSTAIDLSGYVTDAELTTALADYTTTANLTTLLAAKQDTISDLATIRSGASAGASAYQKPSTGIPKTDLASAVQTSLEKADTAVQDISGKADKVTNAANGNFAGLDSNGNLTDSGKKASDFMPSDGVTANPQGTSTDSLTKIGIGNDIYDIQGGGGGTNIPNGSTVTPTNDISIWLKCAELTETYTTLNEVLADDDVMEKLFRSENASDYLVRSTTWATDITANQTAMILIGANDYCANKLVNDSTWSTAIAESAYWNRVLVGLVPTMTSDTSNGVASADSEAVIDTTTYCAYLAFDNDSSTRWISNTQYSSGANFSGWIKYDYTDNRENAVKKIFVKNGNNTSIKGLILQGSNDDSTYTTITTITGLNIGNGGEYFANIENTTKYRYYKLLIEGQTTMTGRAPQLFTFQMYGRIPKTTIYSAANDIVSFVDDEGAKVVTTDATGKGEVTIVCKPNTDITFTSSVAKNPDNLSENYSKVVTIKSSAEPVYVMPNNALYWYGYQSSNCEDISTANGWSRTGVTFRAPTHNTNNISVASGSSSLSGIGNKNALANYTKVHAIFKGNTLVSNNYGALTGTATKAISDLTVISLVPTDALTHVELTTSLSYIYMFCMSGRTGTIYALWYENGGDGNYDKADADLIAPMQKTLTAKKAYAVGEQFVYNQTLYKVEQAIAQGAQITIGTNAVLAGCITDQIKALWDAINS